MSEFDDGIHNDEINRTHAIAQPPQVNVTMPEMHIGGASFRERVGYVLGGVALAAGTYFGLHHFGVIGGSSHHETVVEHGADHVPNKIKVKVARLEPLTIACRALMETAISGDLHAKLLGQDSTGFEAHLGGTGIHGSDPITGVDSSADTAGYGEADTLLCIDDFDAVASQHISPVSPEGTQTVTVDLTSLHPFTRINEEKTLVTTNLASLAEVGDSIAESVAGTSGFLSNLFTLGHHEYQIKLYHAWDEKMAAEVGQVLRQEVVSRVDTDCLSNALPQIEETFKQSYYLEADQKKVPHSSIKFKFEGKPKLTNTYSGVKGWNEQSHFKIDEDQLNKNSAICSETSVPDIKASDIHTVDPTKVVKTAADLTKAANNLAKILP